METDQLDVLKEFKEVDIAKDFPDLEYENDKITDIEVSLG